MYLSRKTVSRGFNSLLTGIYNSSFWICIETFLEKSSISPKFHKTTIDN